METPSQPVLRDIVLVGGGHSHVGVLRRFAMKPVPGVRLTLISRDTHTPYSGMLPGYIAGHYSFDQVHIDLSRLCEFAGARFFRDEAVGVDRELGQVICRQRPAVPYDRLSLNIGSGPQLSGVPGAAEHTVPVKPINHFNQRWLALLARIENQPGPLSLAVVGGGAGGVELVLAIQYRLSRRLRELGLDASRLAIHLFNSSDQLLPTHPGPVRDKFLQVLHQRGVHLHLGARVTEVVPGRLEVASGERWQLDEILWATQAGGQPWLAGTGLALDRAGFVRVRNTLQSLTDPHIFAAGDVASMDQTPREKAGVFAVRQGPVLADNLRRSVLDQPLQQYRPQRNWLALISTGDRFAVASRGRLGFSGRWVWRWKDWIDRRFMARFNDLPEMKDTPAKGGPELSLNAEERAQAISAVAMRCGGCGAKVGSTVLSRALADLRPVQRKDVLVGLQDPDDAAVVRVPEGMAAVQTVDFFRAFISDPYRFGQIAANHSLGDIFAMGAEAQSATAIATVPYGLEAKVEATLRDMMAGAVEVLNEANCSLVGGHTGEGQELALGFAVNGLVAPNSIIGKGGMQPGDNLILTKPLGTGTLLAAHARLAARGRWVDAALDSMALSSQAASHCLRQHDTRACTDITGFGLLGHLLEMTRPSAVDVELYLDALPLLEGARETAAKGILSSLQPANIRLRRGIRDQARWLGHPLYPLLFDPQTAGGLLASVPPGKTGACLRALQELGYSQASLIGRVLPQGDGLEPVTLRAGAPHAA